MRIEIRNDEVLLDGYVNAVGRDSKPIVTPHGRCVEQIAPGAFGRALERAHNVDLLLDHDEERNLGSTQAGNLELFEDNIGLRAIARVKDPEVIQKARDKKLKGWSFGMYVNKDAVEERADNPPRRYVEDLDIFEVSLIDEKLSPCYIGTSVEQRAESEMIRECRGEAFRAVTVDASTKGAAASSIDYTEFENRLQALSGQ